MLGRIALAVFSVLLELCSFSATVRGAAHPSRSWHNQLKRSGAKAARAQGNQYLIGVGKADITGPVADIAFMGYADSSQTGTGLRQRIYSRAFIMGDIDSPNNRVLYLVLDTHSGDTAIRDGIIKGLRSMGPSYSMYRQQNVAVTGTHSHSGPGAWTNYFFDQITTSGFDPDSYSAIVNGTLLSIQRAQESLEPGYLSVGNTRIEDANINRSLFAYLQNPEEERNKYEDNVDKNMTLIRFTRASDGNDMGILTFFATHGTSMYNNNTLVTGDNKGVAAWLFEKEMSNVSPGFVAGFSQANVGDVSPNVQGFYCEGGASNGQECKFEYSTCDGWTQGCHGRGPYPALDDGGTRSCYEIGRRQYAGAKRLYDSMISGGGGTPIEGELVKGVHTFVNLATYTFTHPNGTMVHTCAAALGYGFAGGTVDGPGMFDFKQGIQQNETTEMPLIWPMINRLLAYPGVAQGQCHGEKPIMLDIGEMHWPYDWGPNIVDVQMLRVGQLMFIVSPGEATTMSGRRWREAIANEIVKSNLFATNANGSTPEPIVVIGGPANSYTHYIAKEEYVVQRYEGATTLYGPHTLNAYINLSKSLLPYLSSNPSSQTAGYPPTGRFPQVNTRRSWNLIADPPGDRPPPGREFGDLLRAPGTAYSRERTASAVFVGAHPRNNFRLEGTYAAVQRAKTIEDDEVVIPETPTGQLPYTPSNTFPRRLRRARRQAGAGGASSNSTGPASTSPTSTTTATTTTATTSAEGETLTVIPINTPFDTDDELFPPSPGDVPIPLSPAEWLPFRSDADWDLVFRWQMTRYGFLGFIAGAQSEATISWEIGEDVPAGTYRLVYYGDAVEDGYGKSFMGASPSFVVR